MSALEAIDRHENDPFYKARYISDMQTGVGVKGSAGTKNFALESKSRECSEVHCRYYA